MKCLLGLAVCDPQPPPIARNLPLLHFWGIPSNQVTIVHILLSPINLLSDFYADNAGDALAKWKKLGEGS